jgi:Arc/MetJ family transcription regulator
MTAATATRLKGRISAVEIAFRRDVVREADANNRLEGVYRGPETDEIVEAFVRGDIEVTDMTRLLLALPEPS